VAVHNLDRFARNRYDSGGIPPLGYRINDEKKYEIDEHEAEAVLIIFTMVAGGKTHGEIITHLDNLGHLTKADNRFNRNGLRDILRNERYMGIYTYNNAVKKENHGKWSHR
jgi:site-specific DNA recombinase